MAWSTTTDALAVDGFARTFLPASDPLIGRRRSAYRLGSARVSVLPVFVGARYALEYPRRRRRIDEEHVQ